MAKIAVRIIHGMGPQEKDFVDETIEKLSDHFRTLTGSASDLVVKPIHYADLVQPLEHHSGVG